jgi:hypothetical protein
VVEVAEEEEERREEDDEEMQGGVETAERGGCYCQRPCANQRDQRVA